MKRDSTSPQSVTRVIQILEALCAADAPLGLAQISRALAAPKSSVAALLRGLAKADFVIVAENGYGLGPSAFGLGSALLEARRKRQPSDLIRDGMRRLAERSGETVLFAVRDDDGDLLTYVDVVESRNAVRFAVGAGDRRPLHCTAGGRILLAHQPRKDLQRYLDRLKPRRLTSRTEVDKRKLAKLIDAARSSGVAQTVDQATEGVTGTAAAIRDASGDVIGALVAAAPTSRLRNTDLLVRLVREEAAAISRSLGHHSART